MPVVVWKEEEEEEEEGEGGDRRGWHTLLQEKLFMLFFIKIDEIKWVLDTFLYQLQKTSNLLITPLVNRRIVYHNL